MISRLLCVCLFGIFVSSTGETVASVVQVADAITSVSEDQGEGISTYKPDFFASYYPVTALDMVRQVPGFSIDNGDDVRGFGGAAGNVLIDGERPSTKSDSLDNILLRISAERVAYVELIRGSAPGIDMRGLSRVVNVTLKTDAQDVERNNWSFESTLSRDRVVINAELFHNLNIGGADVTVGLARQGGPFRSTGVEQRFAPIGTLVEHRDEASQFDFALWTPTFNLEKKFANGHILRLSAKAVDTRTKNDESSLVEAPTGAGLSFLRFDANQVIIHDESTEFGGDYSFALAKGLDVKLIGLRNDNTGKGRFTSTSQNVSGVFNASRVSTRDVTSETISRIVVDWVPGKKHSLQFAAEGALNDLDANLLLEADAGAGFEKIDIPISNTRVKERRAEVSTAWVYIPNKHWTLETGLKFETSRLSQSGDASRTRHFSFPKPSFTLSHNISEKNQLRFSAERTVAQLNFNDFVTSVNLIDDLTDVGNPELEPDRAWVLKGEWERRFAQKGSVTFSVRRDWITQVQGRVPFAGVFDAPGNLGGATRWFFEVDTRLPLDVLGLTNATLDANGFMRTSAVTDPVTGERRALGGETKNNFSFEFRQDLSTKKVAWGWAYNNGVKSRLFRLFEEQFNHTGGVPGGGPTTPRAFSAFIETTRIRGMTAIFDVRSVLNRPEERTRFLFAGPRSLGVIEAIEMQQRKSGLRYRLQLRGTF